MRIEHLEIIVEEPSMEALIQILLPRMFQDASFMVHAHQGKQDLLSKLPDRLRGYRSWLPNNWRIFVVIDRDNDDCLELKRRLEDAALAVGLGNQVINRIAIEELEAWYFGDWEAVVAAFPGVARSVPRRAPYRDPDAIAGGTWEAFARCLKNAGYHTAGLRKTEAARAVAEHLEPIRNRSQSFRVFHSKLESVLRRAE